MLETADPMDAERWKLVKSVLGDACTLSREARNALMDERCGSDTALRAEVESLLAAHDGQPYFLEIPAAGLAADWLAEAPTQLGAYRIVRHIASGGMADVYLAERADGSYHKHAAVKILKLGMLGADARRRFDQEREVLANLDHPHIVKLLDGGVTSDSRPYFVMDYVDGDSITAFATANALSTAKRLHLFVKVCDAVSYLHANGIIHRDLKPGNITVNKQGEPKLLDFGIAKLVEPVDADGDVTQTRLRYFTPEYASPEQIRGASARQQADVYSLGLLLYELLSNVRPGLGARGLDLDKIPRALGRIIAKATQGDPEQRLSTVHELATQLRRYQASPPWEFPVAANVRRRWIPAGVALAVLLAAGTGIQAWRLGKGENAFARSQPLTADSGVAAFPSLSPGAKEVVFDRDRSGIYVKPVDNGPERRLTDQVDFCPKWSPDGAWIAFVRSVEVDLFDVMLVHPDGGSLRKLTRIQGIGLAWTLDSKSLAVADRPSSEDPFSIDLVSLATGMRRKLTAPPKGWWGDIASQFSPDGESLAFVRYSVKGKSDIYIAPVRGGEPRRLTHDGVWINGFDWTPSGREILYSACRPNSKCGMWRIQTTATHPEPALIPNLEDMPESLSIGRRAPGGAVRVVYQADELRINSWLWNLDNPAAKPNKIVMFARREETPVFSPDGLQIAFTSAAGAANIWVSDPDGSRRKQITFFKTNFTQAPQWSPNGADLAFVSNAPGTYAIYVAAVAGGVPRRLTGESFEEGAPSWSRDGKWIYFRSNRSGAPQIWRMPTNGVAKLVQLTRGGGIQAFESPDGQSLYFVRSEDEGRLWRVAPFGGEEIEVRGFPRIKAGNWAVTAEGIYGLDLRSSADRSKTPIFFFRFLDGNTSQVAWIPCAPQRIVPGFSARRDGRAFLWAQMEETANLMLIENFR